VSHFTAVRNAGISVAAKASILDGYPPADDEAGTRESYPQGLRRAPLRARPRLPFRPNRSKEDTLASGQIYIRIVIYYFSIQATIQQDALDSFMLAEVQLMEMIFHPSSRKFLKGSSMSL
jgi:hypothetical protein